MPPSSGSPRRKTSASRSPAAPLPLAEPIENVETLEALLETTMQQAVDGIVIVDAQGRLRFANSSAYRLAMGQPNAATVEGAEAFWGDAYDPNGERIELADWPISRAVRGEITLGRELHMVRRDGHAYDVLCSAAPVRAADGTVLAAVVGFTEITQRKAVEAEVRRLNEDLERRVRARTADLEAANQRLEREIAQRRAAEEDLRRSQAALSALIENTNDAIWSIDRERRVVTINTLARQRFDERFGVKIDVGVTIEDQLPAEITSVIVPLFERALAGERLAIEQRYAINGETHHFLVSLNPILEGDSVTGATIFSKNITVRKRAEHQLREREAELAHVLRVGTVGEIAAGLAHEINQPLGAIANYAQGCSRRLRSGEAPPEDLVPIVDEIAHEAHRAAEVLRRLRGLVRKEHARRDAVSLNHIVHEAVRLLRLEAEKRHIEMSFRAAADLPSIRADGIQIEQVVINLLVNAMDAVSPRDGIRGRISVETRALPDAISVAVRDNGIGLDDKMTQKAFDAFFTTKPGGLGMGLAISRSIIEAHRGHLWATANPNGGATFEFTLPHRKK
jgi:PAS domain S-box-containing protein